MPSRIVHFEIPVDDVARAQDFYSAAFGWTLNSMGEGYTLVMTTPSDSTTGRPVDPGAINGGMLKRQVPITSIVITAGVDDINEALAAVEAAGGTVVRGAEPVGEAGIAAYIKDPEGNVIGLFQPTGSDADPS